MQLLNIIFKLLQNKSIYLFSNSALEVGTCVIYENMVYMSKYDIHLKNYFVGNRRSINLLLKFLCLFFNCLNNIYLFRGKIEFNFQHLAFILKDACILF